jgi:hypothetical protein
MIKSLIELEDTFLELLPEREVLAIIKDMEDFQFVRLLLNLA